MIYTDLEFYSNLYPNDDIEDDFNRLSWDASKLMDRLTTGVDGVKKLTAAYPSDKDDAESVKRCACALVNLMHKVEVVQETQEQAESYIKNEDGTYQSALISSRSAGNESISYATGTSKVSALSTAASDPEARKALYRETVESYLSGVRDANGVNLLYMGRYPNV